MLRNKMEQKKYTDVVRLGHQTTEGVFKEEADALPDGYDEKELRKVISKAIPFFVKEILSEKAASNP
ncbi:Catalase [Brevibacillus sp. IT-7CA2]